jgi:flavin reductase (DIM6/NTAB) family NADH-FMN oxidoreductase RutF
MRIKLKTTGIIFKEKSEMKLLPLIHPVPIVVIGTRVIENNIANFTTIGDIAIAGINPPLIMTSLNHSHLSRKCIDKENRFSVNIVEDYLIEKVDYCGMNSGKDVNKNNIFTYQWLDNTPIIKDTQIALVCEVEKRVQIEQRVIYVARVINQSIKDDLKLDELRTISYGLDNNYYSIGTPIAKGYTIGKKV